MPGADGESLSIAKGVGRVLNHYAARACRVVLLIITCYASNHHTHANAGMTHSTAVMHAEEHHYYHQHSELSPVAG